MGGGLELQHVERWITRLRWFGVASGSAWVFANLRNWDDTFTELAVILAALALGTLAMSLGEGRFGSEPSRARLGMAGFVFDGLVVAGLVWTLSSRRPEIVWALMLLLPVEGALRYRLRGALATTAALGLFFVAEGFHIAELNDGGFDLVRYLFVVGLAAAVAVLVGSMTSRFEERYGALRDQSIALADVERLLAVTAHEMRGPLTAITGAAHALRLRTDGLPRPERAALLSMVSRQSRHLGMLIEDLLVTAQLRSDGVTLRSEWTELESVVERAVETAAAKRRDHHLEVFIEPLRCKIDASRTAQILHNLIENAYKYTPERSTVWVAAKTLEGELVLEVADDGHGIPAEHDDALFEPFNRIVGATSKTEGIGIGLYVVRRLVEVMGGRIDLTSSSKGTTFTIHLPCEVVSEEPSRLSLVEGPTPYEQGLQAEGLSS
jgi:signal transduction histidine kinase